ncbi:acyl-CoA thioesterase [Herbiconiux liukaitaii]|uniref:acyl-CoA thioesterase n=1 Tax=Herbiconiux liukaitaii TaxID=3342799 RepID=UPI0035BADA2B
MHFFFRTLLQTLLGRFRSPIGAWDVASTPFRVLPTDLDLLRHMNNGVYLSVLDLARVDLMQRSGLYKVFTQRGWYPVVVAETISFRRSLELWQRFTVETRLLGFDAKACYVEQRFVVGGEICARAYVRARFLKRSGGVVGVEEMRSLAGDAPEDGRMPEWVREWGAASELPTRKTPTPSEWS